MGVPLKFHWTYFILLAFLIYLFGPSFALLYILSQLLHEYSHVWVGQLFGWNTSKIFMTAVGAGAYISYPRKASMKEFFVALAGPMMSFLLVMFSYFIWKIYPTEEIMLWFIINLISLFNLIPIYPSDGGRMLHAIVAKIIGKENALTFSKVLNIFILLLLFIYIAGIMLYI